MLRSTVRSRIKLILPVSLFESKLPERSEATSPVSHLLRIVIPMALENNVFVAIAGSSDYGNTGYGAHGDWCLRL